MKTYRVCLPRLSQRNIQISIDVDGDTNGSLELVTVVLTWQVFDINTTQVAQCILVVEGMSPHDTVVFAGQVIEPAMDRGHTWQVVQHLLGLFNYFLQRRQRKMSLMIKYFIKKRKGKKIMFIFTLVEH